MRLHRSLQAAVAAATLAAPLAAFAQVVGSVTTAPLGHPAPTLAMPMLVVLATALIGLGVYSMRTRHAGVVAGFVLVAGVTLLAGLGYADSGVLVEGGNCDKLTPQTYFSNNENLTSLCPAPIQIVALGCMEAPKDVLNPPIPCSVGLILTTNQICRLPNCDE